MSLCFHLNRERCVASLGQASCHGTSTYVTSCCCRQSRRAPSCLQARPASLPEGLFQVGCGCCPRCDSWRSTAVLHWNLRVPSNTWLGKGKRSVPSLFPFPFPLLPRRPSVKGGERHTRGKFAVRISESIFVQYHLDANQESNFSHYFLFFIPLFVLQLTLRAQSLKPSLDHRIPLKYKE